MAFVYQSNDHKQQEIRGHFRELRSLQGIDSDFESPSTVMGDRPMS